MTFLVTALYKSTPNFNLAHYRDVHMPLAKQRFASYGLQSYQIVSLNPDISQGYAVQCIMAWESEEGMRKGFEAHGKEMGEDLKNFSDVEPVGLLGDVVVSSSA